MDGWVGGWVDGWVDGWMDRNIYTYKLLGTYIFKFLTTKSM